MRKQRPPPSGRVWGRQGAAGRALHGRCVLQGPRGASESGAGTGAAAVFRAPERRGPAPKTRTGPVRWGRVGGALGTGKLRHAAEPAASRARPRGPGRRPRAGARRPRRVWSPAPRLSRAGGPRPPTSRGTLTWVQRALGLRSARPGPPRCRAGPVSAPRLPQSCSHSRTRPSARISPAPEPPARTLLHGAHVTGRGGVGTALTVTHLPPDPPGQSSGPLEARAGPRCPSTLSPSGPRALRAQEAEFVRTHLPHDWVCLGEGGEEGSPSSLGGWGSTQSAHLAGLGVHSSSVGGPPASWPGWIVDGGR